MLVSIYSSNKNKLLIYIIDIRLATPNKVKRGNRHLGGKNIDGG